VVDEDVAQRLLQPGLVELRPDPQVAGDDLVGQVVGGVAGAEPAQFPDDEAP
jgi:hypothetical protein